MQIEKWIRDALEYSGGTHSFEDVLEAIKDSRMQLWAGPRGCLVTEVLVYPQKKVLHIFLAGGELDQLTDMHDDVIAWAKKQGCQALSLSGRHGWKKALKPFGWDAKLTYMVKEF